MGKLVFHSDNADLENDMRITILPGTDTIANAGNFIKMNLVYFPRRYLICIMVSSGIFVANCLFNNMNVAIVQMSSKYNITLENGTLAQVADFDWDSVKRGYILSSISYGSSISNFVAGILSSKFGGVAIFGSGILIGSILNIATPYAANYGLYSVMAIRALEGYFEAVGNSCRMAIFSKWVPLGERSRMVAASAIAIDTSNVICFSVFGIMAHHWGWPSLFYLPGIFGILWSCLWFAIVKDDPADDPKVQEAELNLLRKSISTESFKKVHHPWKKILKSKPVWSQIIVYFVGSWGYTTMYIQFPIFLSDVFRLDITKIGYASSIPYIAQIIITPLSGMLSDYLVVHKVYSLTAARKLFCCVGGYGASILALLLSFSNSVIIVVILMIPFLTFHGAFSSSVAVNCLDIAPRHASVLHGIGGSVSQIASIITPTVTGYIVTNQAREEWRWVYVLCSILYIFGGTSFLLMGTGDVQSWAIDSTRTSDLQNSQKSGKGDVQSSTVDSINTSDTLHNHLSGTGDVQSGDIGSTHKRNLQNNEL